MRPQDDLPAGWLTQFRRGAFSGAGLLLLAVAGCAVPAFAAWLMPGSDSSPASSAVKSGALVALAATHGGVRINGMSVTLAPMLVTVLLGWLVAGQARRADSWSSVLGLATGYGIASGLLAGWASIGSTRAPSLSSALAGGLFVGVLGASARGVESGWHRLSDRQHRIARASGAVLCCYLGAGALLVAGALTLHLPAAIAAQRQLAPGLAGLPIALLGIGLAPNAVLAAVGYLTGPGFGIGDHTRISALATSHGRLPRFPLLAALPTGGPAPAIGLLTIAAVAALAGWLCMRSLRSAGGWPARLVDVAATAALAGSALAVLTAFAAGGIGAGSLSGIGARWWAVGGCGFLLVLISSTAWLAVDLLRAEPVRAEPVLAEPVRARLRSVAGTAEGGPPAKPSRTTAENGEARSRNVG